MTISLTPDQEHIAKKAVEQGLASSAEEFVSAALHQMRDDLHFDVEERLGVKLPSIREAIEAGLNSPVAPWEGAASFHARMKRKHRGALVGDPSK